VTEIISYRNAKVYWSTMEELFHYVNMLRATKIISIRPCTLDVTSTVHCSEVYYEYRLR